MRPVACPPIDTSCLHRILRNPAGSSHFQLGANFLPIAGAGDAAQFLLQDHRSRAAAHPATVGALSEKLAGRFFSTGLDCAAVDS